MAAVVYAEDGTLFLTNDTNNVVDQTQGSVALTVDDMNAIARTHAERADAVSKSGGVYIHIIVPNKETALSHLLPGSYRYQRYGLTPVNQFLQRHEISSHNLFFDPNQLRAAHLQEPAFARTDTHWTHHGAIGYLRRALRVYAGGIAEELDRIPLVSELGTQLGDLGSKAGFTAEEIRIWKPKTDNARAVFNNEIVNEGHVRFFRNDVAPIKARLLINRDSTASWLSHLLREAFEEVLMIHSPDTEIQFVRDFRPNLMLGIQIERFFIRAPKNVESINAVISEIESRKGSKYDTAAFLNELRRS